MRINWDEIDRLIEQYSEDYDYSEEKETPVSYGAEINMSYVSNADGYRLGVHMTDSDGIDVSSEVEGDDLVSVLYAAMQEVYAEKDKVNKQDERQKEIQQLRADIGNLQQRLDNLLNN